MPRKYIRKPNVVRGQWTEVDLKTALDRLKKGEISKHEAQRRYGIPIRTLTRRLHSGNCTKSGLGPSALLGVDNEKRLATYIKRLSAAGFPPDRNSIRTLAYQLAESLGLRHTFSQEKGKAGYQWLQSFLERNKDISFGQAEGLSPAKAQVMNKSEVEEYFQLLEREMAENGLLDKPENIFNVDETGIQLIKKSKMKFTTTGTEAVHLMASKKKGETVSLIACCNAEGRFLPPVLIMKGVNKKPEFSDGLPDGSEIYMNKASPYINSELFLRWFKEHFLPRKPEHGKTILLLDDHSSHSNSIDLLDLACENNVIIICLPSHTTQALQPLDRGFIKALKRYYIQEANSLMMTKKDRSITKSHVGALIRQAWEKAITMETATSGFKACGIFPFNRNAIPDL